MQDETKSNKADADPARAGGTEATSNIKWRVLAAVLVLAALAALVYKQSF